jgi:ectoine hydroxylase-related dioxygenase (phytanoyl-CoA dioxygenase family)
MRRVFLDNTLESKITDKGYVVIPNFLSIEACDNLFGFWETETSSSIGPFSISNWSDDVVMREKVYFKICESLLPVSKLLLQNYNPVMGVYTVKRADLRSDMLLHQDWSLVDESKHRSVSVWVALCDMDNKNGNLQVAEDSHKYAGFPRGVNVPVPFENIRQYMHDYCLTDVPLKRGDAIVFDHRLIHASPPNFSNQTRVAAVLAMKPSDASLIHYYKPLDTQTEYEMLLMDDESFHLLNFLEVTDKPEHIASLGRIPAEFRQLTVDEVRSR